MKDYRAHKEAGRITLEISGDSPETFNVYRKTYDKYTGEEGVPERHRYTIESLEAQIVPLKNGDTLYDISALKDDLLALL